MNCVCFWVNFPDVYVGILTTGCQVIAVRRKYAEVELALSMLNFLNSEHWEVLTTRRKNPIVPGFEDGYSLSLPFFYGNRAQWLRYTFNHKSSDIDAFATNVKCMLPTRSPTWARHHKYIELSALSRWRVPRYPTISGQLTLKKAIT